MSPHRIAVIGAGMAAARFARQLRAHSAPEDIELTLYGAEPDAPYNRTLLTEVLTGRYADVDLPYGPGTTVRTGTEVVDLDIDAHKLVLADGEHTAYDTLVLATGASPVRPPLPGSRTPDGGLLDGVHVLRTLTDCRRLAAAAARARRAVVIGGGVLGVSAGRALATLGPHVEIVHRAPHLMDRHLDAESAAALRHQLTGLGIGIHPGEEARALHGAGRVTAVELADGSHLPADLVLLTCGVRPRTRLARAAGLDVRQGIVVDDRLATSAPDIHALGDCAEHRGVVHGLADPAWRQADTLAALLSGADPRARYTGTRPPTRLTAGPVHLAAFGDPAAEHHGDHEVLRLADATRGTHKKLVRHGDRLAGAVLLGDLTTLGDLLAVWQRDEDLPADPLYLIHEGARS
ncbi:NAD(P)/FAD-dependent oxidoreductase [Streptomyces syringium]|uniref:NAD(P)/FAD-dependent oxidoreductase n=1 Tax=Streptomyces syringium TaxID=76729 RepID=UPI00343844B5